MIWIFYAALYLAVAIPVASWIGGRLKRLAPDPMQEPWGDYPHID